MIRVLQCGMLSGRGGVEIFLMTLYRRIDKTKVQFDFLLRHDQPQMAFEDEILKMGGRIFRVSYGIKENPILAHRSLRRFFDEHCGEFAAVHVNSCFIGNALPLRYAKKYRVPIRVFHSHNAGNMFPSESRITKMIRKYEWKEILRYSTHLFACSDLAGRYMFGSCDFSVIPNAIDVEQFQFSEQIRERKRAELELGDAFTIGFIGRLQYQKNPIFLLEIFAELIKKEPNSKLLIAGKGPLQEEMEAFVSEHKLNDHVRLLGVREDVHELYQAFDCFLLPSRFEGLGIVLIEAQCAGLPCVATADTIPQEAKASEQFSFVSADRSADEWAKEVLKFKDAGCRSRQTGVQNVCRAGYNIEESAADMQRFYECGDL